MPKNPWETADRISDRIVDIVRDELEKMEKASQIQPTQLIVGQCLAMMALFRTVPWDHAPPSLLMVRVAIIRLLRELKVE